MKGLNDKHQHNTLQRLFSDWALENGALELGSWLEEEATMSDEGARCCCSGMNGLRSKLLRHSISDA
jgi:hypothetical protein